MPETRLGWHHRRLRDFDYSGSEHAYFVTIRAKAGTAPFRDERLAKAVIESIDWMREHRRIAVYAYCLMPDHLHILVRLPHGSRPLGELIGAFKRFTTRRSWALGIIGALWQSRYHDHIVRESEDALTWPGRSVYAYAGFWAARVFRRSQSRGLRGEGMRQYRLFQVGRKALALAALGGMVALGVVPAKASSGTTSSVYTTPRWWAKYQVVSSPGFTPGPNPGATKSVSVGANIDVSNEQGPQSETSIAINPSNPSQIVAGSNEIFRLPMRGYFSSDDGKTWGGVDLPLPAPLTSNGIDFGSDPSVAWDTRGNVYYGYIVVFFSNQSFSSVTGTEMAVARSSDAGRAWTATYFNFQSGGAKFNDKPIITVDTNPASLFRDTIYAAWDNATGGNGKPSSSNAILVSRSSDGGVNFSQPVFASDTLGGPQEVIGADPFVGPDGRLHVAWNDILHNTIAESTSSDGGMTFGPTRVVAPKQAAFDVGIPAMSSRRALVYPACGADASGGASNGTLYCSWMDTTSSNGTDIFVSHSTDGGSSWSAPLRVNNDPIGVPNDQFNQWLAVDPIDGSVNLSWNDTRNDPTHVSTDIYYSRSTTGGLSFSPNAKVTSATTNESCCGADLGNQYGDYEGIAALGGSIHTVWTDRRASVAALDEEVFTATLTAKHTSSS
jgi:REP element-mobilizing transposase RayT